MLSVSMVQSQTLQWEDYSPVSTLMVEEHLVAKAKYRFVDAHGHQ